MRTAIFELRQDSGGTVRHRVSRQAECGRGRLSPQSRAWFQRVSSSSHTRLISLTLGLLSSCGETEGEASDVTGNGPRSGDASSARAGGDQPEAGTEGQPVSPGPGPNGAVDGSVEPDESDDAHGPTSDAGNADSSVSDDASSDDEPSVDAAVTTPRDDSDPPPTDSGSTVDFGAQDRCPEVTSVETRDLRAQLVEGWNAWLELKATLGDRLRYLVVRYPTVGACGTEFEIEGAEVVRRRQVGSDSLVESYGPEYETFDEGPGEIDSHPGCFPRTTVEDLHETCLNDVLCLDPDTHDFLLTFDDQGVVEDCFAFRGDCEGTRECTEGFHLATVADGDVCPGGNLAAYPYDCQVVEEGYCYPLPQGGYCWEAQAFTRECPEGLVVASACLTCGPFGGCGQRSESCGFPCAAPDEDEAADAGVSGESAPRQCPRGTSCLDGLCEVTACF